MAADCAIEAEGLVKAYGKVRALDGVDLSAPGGTVLGLLGPNGAGKTTAVRILTTLLPADGGSGRVARLAVRAPASPGSAPPPRRRSCAAGSASPGSTRRSTRT